MIGVTLAAALGADVYAHVRTRNLGGVNRWGYRGTPVGRKPPGATRVVMVGGSTTYGWGLPARESIPSFLEGRLNREDVAGRPAFSVVNLGAPGQGAFGMVYDLADYEYLSYDVVVMYSGINDLGPYTARGLKNDWLFRRASPVFRLTGYFPILPLILREKAAALTGGPATGIGQIAFQPTFAARGSAAALRSTAALADQLGRQLGRLSDEPPRSTVETGCIPKWRMYCGSVKDAVSFALGRNKRVLFVTQPYLSDDHIEQQANVAAMLQAAFGDDRRVRYLNLGRAIDMRDASLAYDGVHLVARGNDLVASHLVAPVLGLIGAR